MRIAIEQGLRRHDLSVLAETALRNLLLDPRFLYRMQRTALGQSFKRGDFALNRGRRRDARSRRNAIDDHRASAALAEAAAKSRSGEIQVVTKDVQQWSGRVD